MVKSSLPPFHRCSYTIFWGIFQPEFNICFIRLWQMIQLCKIFLKDSLYFFPLVIIPKDCLIIHINACAKLPAFIFHKYHHIGIDIRCKKIMIPLNPVSLWRSIYPIFFRDISCCPVLRCFFCRMVDMVNFLSCLHPFPFFLHTLLDFRSLLYRFSKSFHDIHKLLIPCLAGGSIKHFQVTAFHDHNHIIRGITVKTHIHPQPAGKPKGLFFKA